MLNDNFPPFFLSFFYSSSLRD
uniref:Uncharacterized protein n=1 Tax=Nelumbo nucifera TaxID=4432 RepID=A0A822Y4H5_NELNU|nr:TPA_asm: hypothetical protein HUJ06_027687 [Nelumbo nucifera]